VHRVQLDGHRRASPAGDGNAFTGHRATVLALLGESAADLEGGNPSGLDTVSVMEKSGATSAVYQAFIQLDGQVLGAEAQDGNTGLRVRFCRREHAPEATAPCLRAYSA